MAFWLMKSEPGDYSIADLARDRREWWTGVRNYQARNFMLRDMKVGDGALFYHSSCPEPGVYGIAEVCAAAAPDPTQFVPDGNYYDPKATADKPRWFCVQIKFVRQCARPFLLADIRQNSALSKMQILKRGNRLSITPVAAAEWRCIVRRCGG